MQKTNDNQQPLTNQTESNKPMITTSQMYWLVKLDDIQTMLILIGSLVTVAAAATTFSGAVYRSSRKRYSWDTDESIKQDHQLGRTMHRYSVPSLLVGIVLLTVGVLVPTTKEMAAILIVPRVANSEKVQTVGNRLYDLAVEWMDELRPNKQEKKAH